MTVVDLKSRGVKKRRRQASRDLVPFEKATGAARFFQRMVKDVESDLGGRRYLTRIEGELIRAFCGAATLLQYQNVQVAIGRAARSISAATRLLPVLCCGSARGSGSRVGRVI